MADLVSTRNSRWIAGTLAADEREALRLLAFQERRDARQQAALIIRRELERRGLLAAVGCSSEGQAAANEVSNEE
ncbi:MAG: hypothetical protein IT335_15775 [Thermomicrobiales bacterium]|nr:hypothetical protein [Thermomicrobiales bacterium]